MLGLSPSYAGILQFPYVTGYGSSKSRLGYVAPPSHDLEMDHATTCVVKGGGEVVPAEGGAEDMET